MHKISGPWAWAALALVTVGQGAGCGGSGDGLDRQAVGGLVTFQGQPIDAGSISFEPLGPEARLAGGAVIENGTFQVDQERGLPPGEYIVRVSSPDTTAQKVSVDGIPGELGMAPPERIPPSWNVKSEQTITIESGGANRFELAIP